MGIEYIKGDATAPIGEGKKLLVHVCNDVGKWGKGFVLAVSRRWHAPENEYRAAFARSPIPLLGDVQFVDVGGGVYVANLIGQHGIAKGIKGEAPIRYEAVRQGLEKIAVFAKQHNATVHMPRIGCGLAGGSWDKIEPIIIQTLNDFSVVVYDR